MSDPRTYHEAEYDGETLICCDQCKFPQLDDGRPNHVDWCDRDASREG